MENNNSNFKEYKAVRNEIADRAKFLHGILNFCIAIIVIELLTVLVSILLDKDFLMQKTILLIFSPVYALIAFNYQASQMTMEALVKYLKEEGLSKWDLFYEEYKKGQRLTSFLKILPLFTMQIVALVVFLPGITSLFTSIMFILDLGLFVLEIVNFKYKLEK